MSLLLLLLLSSSLLFPKGALATIRGAQNGQQLRDKSAPSSCSAALKQLFEQLPARRVQGQ
eukprot:15460601-Alexandrium_andersonii.AAC.1